MVMAIPRLRAILPHNSVIIRDIIAVGLNIHHY